jgi:hypothetical protein
MKIIIGNNGLRTSVVEYEKFGVLSHYNFYIQDGELIKLTSLSNRVRIVEWNIGDPIEPLYIIFSSLNKSVQLELLGELV